MALLVTGGAGFIGSNFIIDCIKNYNEKVINLDKLTYAGNIENLAEVKDHSNYEFIKGDILDVSLLKEILKKYKPSAVVHFAAESHVDRSIDNPNSFLQTNIIGTFNLLDSSRMYWDNLSKTEKLKFRFIHISTDEVFGSLSEKDEPFSEENRFKPNSPYSASKASSDHLVRAWNKTYGLPIITTNCSNNYGPYQFPEKFVPLMILNAIDNKKLPIYGDGNYIRDWIYVKDHCNAIFKILKSGVVGESYNIGGENEKKNIDIVNQICEILDDLRPKNDHKSYKNLISFVDDRPGHDRRYAINNNKISKELKWKPKETFDSGLKKTISWYLNNSTWIKDVQNRGYKDWIRKKYSFNL